MCWRAEARCAALAVLLAGAGCARGEPPPSPPVSTAEPQADTIIAVSDRLRLAGRSGNTTERERFPHPAHAGIDCARCHAGVSGHATHPGVGCRDCHGAVASAAAGAPQDCNTCHHESSREVGCAHCHEERGMPPDGSIAVVARFSVGAGATRELPFRHAVHQQVECARCHSGSGRAPIPDACASCHERHHTARADCVNCHPPPAPSAHTTSAHLGCGGSGCHQDRAVAALPLSRSVCLACHRAQRDHEPGSECADCHLVSSAGGRTGAVP